MERKEPVIDSRARRPYGPREAHLARREGARRRSGCPNPCLLLKHPTPAAPPAPIEPAASQGRLTEAEQKAIALQLAPAVEAAVKHALRETLDLALQNALARVRGDVERSVNGLVADAVSREIARLDLGKILRR